MSKKIKNQAAILQKLGIEKLNKMQEDAQLAIHSKKEIVLLSPTGTGKTLAFLLPIISELDLDVHEVQVLIIVPSRELALQIEQVVREMGTGFKTNAIYGGRAGAKDRIDLQQKPAILIGTPGRIADHLRRESFSTAFLKTLVLDEFDKSLEVGFEAEMKEILAAISPNKKVLTSATQGIEIPRFVELTHPHTLNYLAEKSNQLQIKTVVSAEKDKLKTLVKTLAHIGNKPGIVFCNFKETISRVSDFLTQHNISHGCFQGGMEQKDRERALIKFRNGTHQVLLATDLAARGIDVPELAFIIHYQLPLKAEEFTHRNGRTARMHSNGTAYVLKWAKENLPEFITNAPEIKLEKTEIPAASPWTTLFVSGGRKDKISKGDIAGLFFKQGKLKPEDVGVIELKLDCAFVGVKSKNLGQLLPLVNQSKLKKKKVRIFEI